MKPGRYVILNKNHYWVYEDYHILDIIEIDEERGVTYVYVGDKILRNRKYLQFMELKLIPHSSLMEELI
jgi:hypothetical protein